MFRPGKGVFWGVLCSYMSSKGMCDCWVKNRGWGWYSGQNEILSGQDEWVICMKNGQKCSRIGKKTFNHPAFGSAINVDRDKTSQEEYKLLSGVTSAIALLETQSFYQKLRASSRNSELRWYLKLSVSTWNSEFQLENQSFYVKFSMWNSYFCCNLPASMNKLAKLALLTPETVLDAKSKLLEDKSNIKQKLQVSGKKWWSQKARRLVLWKTAIRSLRLATLHGPRSCFTESGSEWVQAHRQLIWARVGRGYGWTSSPSFKQADFTWSRIHNALICHEAQLGASHIFWTKRCWETNICVLLTEPVIALAVADLIIMHHTVGHFQKVMIIPIYPKPYHLFDECQRKENAKVGAAERANITMEDQGSNTVIDTSRRQLFLEKDCSTYWFLDAQ